LRPGQRADGHVYVWQAGSPHPIQVLAGHDETVNSVSWNPVSSRKLFASCSDDGTVRVWQPALGDAKEENVEMKEEPMDGGDDDRATETASPSRGPR
jgi:WD40 repeat protein